MALSVILSFIIWGFIVWETNPEISREFQGIAVTSENVPANMLIVGGLPSVAVTLRGPQDDMRGIVPSDVTASIDFADVDNPGIREYEIVVDAPREVREIVIDPGVVEIELDLIVTETFQVVLREDAVRPASLTSIDLSTEIASVRGPQAVVDQVSRIEIPLNLQGRTDSFRDDYDLVAVSEAGRPVDGIEISPESIALSVTFESTAKDVPVVVICACVIEDRLDQIVLTTAAAIPSTIRLTGPSAALSEISEVRTTAIDTSELDESGWILDVELDPTSIPESVNVSDQTVDVWVPVTPERVEVPEVDIEIVGLADGLAASLSSDTVGVVVSGSDELLQQSGPLEIMALVNLTDLDAGTYTVDVALVVPPGVSYEEVSPGTVRVEIRSSSSTSNRLRFERSEPEAGVR